MLILCKLIRPGGTIVTLGKGDDRRDYHFKPQDPKAQDKNHVCDVTDKKDIATFLAISEGYEIHDDAITEARTGAPQAPVKPAAANGVIDKAALITAVTEKTGKKPHPSTSVAKLRAMLE